MAAKRDKHFIKSPYKVVNGYEAEFIRQWNKNTSEALVTVVEFIAKLVTDENKEIEKNG